MGNINAVVDVMHDGDVAIIAMDNPPVNALGHALREGLMAAFEQLRSQPATKAVVLTGTIAGVLRWGRHHRIRQAAQAARSWAT